MKHATSPDRFLSASAAPAAAGNAPAAGGSETRAPNAGRRPALPTASAAASTAARLSRRWLAAAAGVAAAAGALAPSLAPTAGAASTEADFQSGTIVKRVINLNVVPSGSDRAADSKINTSGTTADPASIAGVPAAREQARYWNDLIFTTSSDQPTNVTVLVHSGATDFVDLGVKATLVDGNGSKNGYRTSATTIGTVAAGGNANFLILKGYADDNSSTSRPTLTVSGLDSVFTDGYDVYILSAGDSTGRGPFTVNGVTYTGTAGGTIVGTVAWSGPSAITSAPETLTEGTGGYFLHISDQTAATLSIAGYNNGRTPLNAVQIVGISTFYDTITSADFLYYAGGASAVLDDTTLLFSAGSATATPAVAATGVSILTFDLDPIALASAAIAVTDGTAVSNIWLKSGNVTLTGTGTTAAAATLTICDIGSVALDAGTLTIGGTNANSDALDLVLGASGALKVEAGATLALTGDAAVRAATLTGAGTVNAASTQGVTISGGDSFFDGTVSGRVLVTGAGTRWGIAGSAASPSPAPLAAPAAGGPLAAPSPGADIEVTDGATFYLPETLTVGSFYLDGTSKLEIGTVRNHAAAEVITLTATAGGISIGPGATFVLNYGAATAATTTLNFGSTVSFDGAIHISAEGFKPYSGSVFITGDGIGNTTLSGATLDGSLATSSSFTWNASAGAWELKGVFTKTVTHGAVGATGNNRGPDQVQGTNHATELNAAVSEPGTLIILLQSACVYNNNSVTYECSFEIDGGDGSDTHGAFRISDQGGTAGNRITTVNGMLLITSKVARDTRAMFNIQNDGDFLLYGPLRSNTEKTPAQTELSIIANGSGATFGIFGDGNDFRGNILFWNETKDFTFNIGAGDTGGSFSAVPLGAEDIRPEWKTGTGANNKIVINRNLGSGIDDGSIKIEHSISGAASIEQNGTGRTLLLGNNNALTGTITVNAGTLGITSDANLNAAASSRVLKNGATLELANTTPTTYAKQWTIDATGGVIAVTGTGAALSAAATTPVATSATLTVAGSGALTKTGIGTLNIATPTAVTYVGAITVLDGPLGIVAGASLGSGTITLGTGGVDTGTSLVLDVADPAGSVSLARNILGAGSLAKTGLGAAEITGSVAAAIPVTVAGGTLTKSGAGTDIGGDVAVTGDAVTGGEFVLAQGGVTGDVSVSGSTARATLGGAGATVTVGGDIVVNAGSALLASATVAGGVTLEGGSSTAVEISGGSVAGEFLVRSGTATVTGTATFTGGVSIQGGVFAITAAGSGSTISGSLSVAPGAALRNIGAALANTVVIEDGGILQGGGGGSFSNLQLGSTLGSGDPPLAAHTQSVTIRPVADDNGAVTPLDLTGAKLADVGTATGDGYDGVKLNIDLSALVAYFASLPAGTEVPVLVWLPDSGETLDLTNYKGNTATATEDEGQWSGGAANPYFRNQPTFKVETNKTFNSVAGYDQLVATLAASDVTVYWASGSAAEGDNRWTLDSAANYWVNADTGAADYYHVGDAVVFTDPGADIGGGRNLALQGGNTLVREIAIDENDGVSPASVLVHTAGTFKFTGGTIAGGNTTWLAVVGIDTFDPETNALTNAGVPALTLDNAANTFGAGLFVAHATLTAPAADRLGNGDITLADAAVLRVGTESADPDTAPLPVTFGTSTDTRKILVLGSGTLSLPDGSTVNLGIANFPTGGTLPAALAALLPDPAAADRDLAAESLTLTGAVGETRTLAVVSNTGFYGTLKLGAGTWNFPAGADWSNATLSTTRDATSTTAAGDTVLAFDGSATATVLALRDLAGATTVDTGTATLQINTGVITRKSTTGAGGGVIAPLGKLVLKGHLTSDSASLFYGGDARNTLYINDGGGTSEWAFTSAAPVIVKQGGGSVSLTAGTLFSTSASEFYIEAGQVTVTGGANTADTTTTGRLFNPAGTAKLAVTVGAGATLVLNDAVLNSNQVTSADKFTLTVGQGGTVRTNGTAVGDVTLRNGATLTGNGAMQNTSSASFAFFGKITAEHDVVAGTTDTGKTSTVTGSTVYFGTAGGITLNTPLATDTLAFAAVVNGTVPVSKIGAGTVQFGGETALASTAVTGGINVLEGRLIFTGKDNTAASPLYVNIGDSVGGTAATVEYTDGATIAGTREFALLTDGSTLELNRTNTPLVLSNTISDATAAGAGEHGIVSKRGAAMATLTGNLTAFTGAYVVTNGTLVVAPSFSASAQAYVGVTGGGSLQIGSNGTGTLVLSNTDGATSWAGHSVSWTPSTGFTGDIAGNLTLENAHTLDIGSKSAGYIPETFDRLDITGTLSFSQTAHATYTTGTIGGGAGTPVETPAVLRFDAANPAEHDTLYVKDITVGDVGTAAGYGTDDDGKVILKINASDGILAGAAGAGNVYRLIEITGDGVDLRDRYDDVALADYAAQKFIVDGLQDVDSLVNTLAVTDDGKAIALTVSYSGKVLVWNGTTGNATWSNSTGDTPWLKDDPDSPPPTTGEAFTTYGNVVLDKNYAGLDASPLVTTLTVTGNVKPVGINVNDGDFNLVLDVDGLGAPASVVGGGTLIVGGQVGTGSAAIPASLTITATAAHNALYGTTGVSLGNAFAGVVSLKTGGTLVLDNTATPGVPLVNRKGGGASPATTSLLGSGSRASDLVFDGGTLVLNAATHIPAQEPNVHTPDATVATPLDNPLVAAGNSTDRTFTLGTAGGTIEVNAPAGATFDNGYAYEDVVANTYKSDNVTIAGNVTRRYHARVAFTDSTAAVVLTAAAAAANSVTLTLGGDAEGVLLLALADANIRVVKTGTGTWFLGGASTFAGGLEITGGRVTLLTVTANSAAGAASNVITLAGGSLANGPNATALLNNNGAAATTSPAAATLELPNPVLVGRNLDLYDPVDFTAGVGSIEVGNASSLTLSGEVATLATGAYPDAPLLKTGLGDLVLARGNTQLNGGIQVLAGSLTLAADAAAGNGTLTLADDTTLNIGAAQVTLHGIARAGSATDGDGLDATAAPKVLNATDAPATLVLDLPAGAGTWLFSGDIVPDATGETLSITKTGGGSLQLTGNNAYTGATTVAAGVLIPRAGDLAENDFTGGIIVTDGGTLDIAGHDLGAGRAQVDATGAPALAAAAALAATITGTGAGGLGAVEDSTGGGVLPDLVLAGDALVRSVATTALGGVRSASATARHTLTLGAGAGAAGVRFTLDGEAGVARSTRADIVVEPDVTLALAKAELLAADTALTLSGEDAPRAAAVLELRNNGGEVTKQTFASVSGRGEVTGDGELVLAVPAGKTATFDGVLKESVNLTVNGAGTFVITRDNETTGTIRVAGVLRIAEPLREFATSTQETDPLGHKTSTVIFNGGTLAYAGDALSATDRVFTLDGASSGFRAEGAGAVVLTAGARLAFAEGVTAHTLRLEGNGTGANRVDTVLADPVSTTGSGALSLVKSGTSVWTFGAQSTFTGGVTIQNGEIVLGVDDALPYAARLVLGASEISGDTSGALKLDGHSQTIGGLDVRGIGQDNRIYNGDAVHTDVTPTLTYRSALDETFSGALGIAGDDNANRFHFEKDGGGTLTLEMTVEQFEAGVSQTLNYTGNTIVSAGTLALAGALQLASREIIVMPDAHLDVSALAGDKGLRLVAGQTLRAGTDGRFPDIVGNLTLEGGKLTAGATTTAANGRAYGQSLNAEGSTLTVLTPSTIEFPLSNSITAGNGSIIINDADFRATATVNLVQVDGSLAIGTYTLVTVRAETAEGVSITGASGALRNLGAYDAATQEFPRLVLNRNAQVLDPRYVCELKLITTEVTPGGPTTGSIVLEVKSTGDLVPSQWNGGITTGGYGVWDNETPNFTLADGTPGAYFPGATALFNDAGASKVLVGGNVYIGRITFNNDGAYTLLTDSARGGSPILGEGYIEKLGSGELLLDGPNRFTGIAILKSDGSGEPEKDANNNTLRQASVILGQGTIAVAHDGALGTGTVLLNGGTLRGVDEDGTERRITNPIVAATGAQAAIEARDAGETFILEGALSTTGDDTSAGLTKTGAGKVVIAGDTSAYAGRILVADGTLALNGADFSKAIVSLDADGTVLEINSLNDAGELRGVAGSVIRGSNGELSAGARGANSTFAGNLSGSFLLVKEGAGSLALTGDNSAYSGNITVNAGRLQIGDGLTGVSGTGDVTVAAGATVALNLPPVTDPATGAEIPARLEQEIGGAGTFAKEGTNTLQIVRENNRLTGVVRVADGVLEIAEAGTIGAARAEVGGKLLLNRAGIYEFSNTVTGSGTLEKTGAARAVWTGNTAVWDSDHKTWVLDGASDVAAADQGVNIVVSEGVLVLGDVDATGVHYRQTRSTSVRAGASLLLEQGAGSDLTLGNLYSAAGASIEKSGPGTTTVTGTIGVEGGLTVNAGEFAIGDGTGRVTTVVTGALQVRSGATLSVSREGETQFAGALTDAGALKIVTGTATLLSGANAISGTVGIAAGATLQIGGENYDGGTVQSSSFGSAPVAVNIASGATLRYVASNSAAGSPGTVAAGAAYIPGGSAVTGANVSLAGSGVVEFAGADGDELYFNSTAGAAFTGTVRAVSGTLAVPAVNLPVAAALDATGAGVARIESSRDAVADGPTPLAPNLGSGDGTILLAPAANVSSVKFVLANSPSFQNGAVRVAAGAALELGGQTLRAAETWVNAGASLSATGGGVSGLLVNNGEVTASPTALLNIAGDFYHNGALTFDLTGAAAGDDIGASLRFAGRAVFDAASTLRVETTPARLAAFRDGEPLTLFTDTAPATGAQPDISGAFATITIAAEDAAGGWDEWSPTEVLAFNAGGGAYALMFTNNLMKLPGMDNLHDGLDDFGKYLSRVAATGGNSDLVAAIALADNRAELTQQISPLGHAAAAAMSIGEVRQHASTLHAHIESLRYDRGFWNAPSGTQLWLAGDANFQRNRGGAGAAPFDYDTYGGTVGLDVSVGEDLIFGVTAGYNSGRATIELGNRFRQENARAGIYATAFVNEIFYIEASATGGFSRYESEQRYTDGSGQHWTAKGKPDGADFGASLIFGLAAGISDTVSATPYFGVEYSYATVDGFSADSTKLIGSHIEDGERVNDYGRSGFDLRTSSFSRDSLRFKVGGGLNWQPRTTLAAKLRLTLDAAYFYEVLDHDARIRGRFVNETADDSFTVRSRVLSEHTVQIGPSVEIGLNRWATLQFGYRLEADFDKQFGHHFNASFRARF